MKNTIQFTLLLIAFLTLSCSKSDTPEPTTPAVGGKITYTVDGTTTTITDEVSTAVLQGGTKIGLIANRDLTTYVGDSGTKTFAVGVPVTSIAISIKINGVQWVRVSSGNTMTITSYDGTTIKGTFSGQVANNDTGTYIYKPISGTFETTDITKV
jgi:hypothetical protein